MTLIELIDKLNEIKDSYSSDKKSEVIFSAEDDYNTFDVEIKGVEVEDGKVFLS
jgi:hypothetical protein